MPLSSIQTLLSPCTGSTQILRTGSPGLYHLHRAQFSARFRILRTRRSITRLELSCRPARRESPAHRHCYRVIQFSPTTERRATSSQVFLTFANGSPLSTAAPAVSLRVGPDSFLLSDDYLGLIYFIHPRAHNASCSGLRPTFITAHSPNPILAAFLRRVSAKDAVIPFCNLKRSSINSAFEARIDRLFRNWAATSTSDGAVIAVERGVSRPADRIPSPNTFSRRITACAPGSVR